MIVCCDCLVWGLSEGCVVVCCCSCGGMVWLYGMVAVA